MKAYAVWVDGDIRPEMDPFKMSDECFRMKSHFWDFGLVYVAVCPDD